MFYFNKAVRIALFFILAVIARAAFINISGGFSAFNAGDTVEYLARAKSLLSGNVATFSNFGFSLYLAMIFKVFGYPSIFVIKLANILLGSLTVLVIFAAGKEFYNKNTGILAALICIFHINLLLWTGYILTEPLFILFLSLSILYFLKFANSKKILSLFLAFTMLAIGGLIRDIAFLLLVPAGIWVSLVLCKRYLVKAVLMVTCIVAFLSIPWIITYNFLPSHADSISWSNSSISGEVLKGVLWNESGRGTSGVDIRPKTIPIRVAQFTRNPYEYLKLMLRKLKVYWWIFTPEMSFSHKLFSNPVIIGLTLNGNNLL